MFYTFHSKCKAQFCNLKLNTGKYAYLGVGNKLLSSQAHNMACPVHLLGQDKGWKNMHVSVTKQTSHVNGFQSLFK